MDLKKFKLGVGPMSPLVTELCLKYSYENNFPLLIIGSRNQVDYDGGYAFSTDKLTSSIKNSQYYNSKNTLICRDHCGPYFSDRDIGLSTEKALNRCFGTIQTDLYNGFDIIHIDVGRVDKSEQLQVAKRMFDFAIRHNPNVMFEFGSEDNNGNTNDNIQYYINQLDFLDDYKPYVKYFVAQTGSLTKHKQVGKFNLAVTKQIVDLVHDRGLLFKEHNADYLSKVEVRSRILAEVDCLNVAPQFAVCHTKGLLKLQHTCTETFNEFFSFVLSQQYYKKWITHEVLDNITKFLVSAHYFFNTPIGIKLHKSLNYKKLELEVQEFLFKDLDEYRLEFENLYQLT